MAVVAPPGGQDIRALVLQCNKEGMDSLSKGVYKHAFEQLKYAEAILTSSPGGAEAGENMNLFAVTCNNLGCYYKKVGKLHAALSYLRKALKMEVDLCTDDATVAGTHLNICAILSKLDKHDKAVQNALCALELIKKRVESPEEKVSQDDYSVLAIAYHNVAVERDFLHQYDRATKAFQEGHSVARRYLGENHPLTIKLGERTDALVQKSTKVGKAPSSANYMKEQALNLPSPRVVDRSLEPQAVMPSLPPLQGVGRPRSGVPKSAQEDTVGQRLSARQVRQDAADWVAEENAGWASTAPGPRHLARELPEEGHGLQAPLSSRVPRTSEVPDIPAPLTARLPHKAQWPPPQPPLMPASQPQPQQQFSQPSFLERIVQEVPAAAAFAQPPPSPPPLIMNSSSGAPGGGRRPRSKGRSESPGLLSQPLPPEPPPVSSDSPRGPRRLRNLASTSGSPAPAPPSGRPGRPPRRPQRDHSRGAGGGTLAADTKAGGGLPGGVRAQHSQLLRQAAAEKIQRIWRASHLNRVSHDRQSKKENLAATMIQARWRAFWVRRSKQNKAATMVQKYARGMIIRRRKLKYKSALCIQRHMRGLIMRRRRQEQVLAAIALQKRARGIQERDFAKQHRARKVQAALVLQRGVKRWQAMKIVREKRKERDAADFRQQAAVRIQSVARGKRGRQRFQDHRSAWLQVESQQKAAIRLQSFARRKQAETKVNVMRHIKLEEQHHAATVIRKFWLRHIYRRRFLQLQKEFRTHVKSIVAMQRYVRGFLVRVRMWRDAIRCEEELWAAIEIQRCWRGYLGRVRWELEYDSIHSRLVATLRLQRHVRGWLARTRAHRIRKRKARADFLRARTLFKAAQKLQAFSRGVLCRRKIRAQLNRKLDAVKRIQRVWRGYKTRSGMWEQVLGKRTVQIQAAIRGFLVRNRRHHILVKVACVQNNYRKWLRFMPEAERRRRVDRWRQRRQEAKALAAGPQ